MAAIRVGVPSLSNAGWKLQPLPRNVLSSFILLVSFYRYYYCFFSKSLFLIYWKKEIRFPFAAFGQKKEKSCIFTSLGRMCKYPLRSLIVKIPFSIMSKNAVILGLQITNPHTLDYQLCHSMRHIL